MNELIYANMTQRPARALASIAGVGLGVVLILVTVGLARGMLRSSGQRESRVGAELLFQPRGSFGVGITGTPLALPTAYAAALEAVDGVAAATPVGRYVRTGAGGLGFELIEGVVFGAGSGQDRAGHATYPDITGLELAHGRLPADSNEIVIDPVRAKEHGTRVGDSLEFLGQRFTIVGVYGAEVGARIKMPLAGMQRLLGNADRCSWILVKTDKPELQGAVAARIDQRFPGNQVIFTRDIPGYYERGLPSLRVFLDVVVGLATIISGLVVLLAMYTAVTERTREIGILKSLGASRGRVIRLILREAVALSLLGVAAGLTAAFLVATGITHSTTLIVVIEARWMLLAGGVALASGSLGALYPALVAARRDPVEALAYE